MGTRADFYIKVSSARAGMSLYQWIGSQPIDGFPEMLSQGLVRVNTGEKFAREVERQIATIPGSRFPREGWPWPWEDSTLTDFAYCFLDGQVQFCVFGRGWFPVSDYFEIAKKERGTWKEEVLANREKRKDFPNMSEIKHQGYCGGAR